MPEDKPKAKSKKRRIILILIISLALLAIFTGAGTKFYLIINNLLGNDLLLKLSASEENIRLSHNENQTVEMDIYATTNPFCKIECSSEFKDLGSGKIMETSRFNMTSATFRSRKYSISASKTGEGQDIYSFNVRCTSKKTFLCHSDEKARKRNVIITVKYGPTSGESVLKNETRETILGIEQKADMIMAVISWINSTAMGSVIGFSDIGNISALSGSIEEIAQHTAEARQFWAGNDFGWLGLNAPGLKGYIRQLAGAENMANGIRDSVIAEAGDYNGLLANLTEVKAGLERLTQMNVSNETAMEINKAIAKFNSSITSFGRKSTLREKREIIAELSGEAGSIMPANATMDYAVPKGRRSKISSQNGTDGNSFAYETLADVPQNMTLPGFAYTPKEFLLEWQKPKCCYNGKCEECCDESCYDDDSLYPVILLHGHDFSRYVSAEHSLDTFEQIQEKLENDGYLNAGSIILSKPDESQRGAWGMLHKPAAVKASYYFDLYVTTGKGRVIETKTDSIDSYALRLKDIVEDVKLKTNKKKVIIIAHSMGGLVSRRYMQIFGDEAVDKLIMIGTPNQGIDESILKYCRIFGEKVECNDLYRDSLLINKLENFPEKREKMYSIAGTGCEMGNVTGDGIVSEDSAYLEKANNYVLRGTCGELSYLHSDLLDTDKYPEVYGRLKSILSQYNIKR